MLTKNEIITIDAIAQQIQGALLNLSNLREGKIANRPIFKPQVNPEVLEPVTYGKKVNGKLTKTRVVVAPGTSIAPVKSTKASAKVTRSPKAPAIIEALLRKGGVSPAELRKIAGWAIGPAMIERLAKSHGFSWYLANEGKTNEMYRGRALGKAAKIA